MLRGLILIVSLFLFSHGKCSNDTTPSRKGKLEFYPLLEFGFNHNNIYKNPNHYTIQSVSTGIGIHFFNFKFEFSYPFLQSFDSLRTFMNTYSGTLGYSIETKSKLRLAPKLNYMYYEVSENRTAYDIAQPNINVPINYIYEIEIKRLTYIFGIERRWKNHFGFNADIGLSFFKIEGRTISAIDGTYGSFNHELSNPEKKNDIVKLYFGLGINFSLGGKS
jgi:hypothetical protein